MKIYPKKSLGQNFLIDKNILDKIVNVTSIRDKTILEIGPGTGNLTSFVLKKKPKKFYVIEKDDNLAINLNKNAYKSLLHIVFLILCFIQFLILSEVVFK